MHAADLNPGNVFRFVGGNSPTCYPELYEKLANGQRRQLTGIAAGHVADFVLPNSEVECLEIEPGVRLKSIRRLAEDAIEVQDACNLSGVAQSFARAIVHLRRYLAAVGEDSGTLAVTIHPIVTLWLDKMRDLNGRPSAWDFMNAYDECRKIAGRA
jgi:hypothetical protein